MPDAEIKRLRENNRFQERSWIVERVGWAMMGLLILAALAGVFSRGPLSYTQASAVDQSFTVRYERFMRHMTAAELEINLHLTSSDVVPVTLETQLAEALSIQRINPQPLRSAATPNGLLYDFAASAAPARITFDVKPSAIGRINGRITVGGRAATIRSFVYP